MKNHYSVLQISREAKTNEIKEKCKELIKNVKNSNISTEQKNKLNKEIYHSYQFLTDYHSRKSLDDYLDSQYKIIPAESKLPIQNFGIASFDFNNLAKELFDLENFISTENNNKNSYYYSSSSVTTNEMDKDGNIISKTKTFRDNNGKKDKKEYSNFIKKDQIL